MDIKEKFFLELISGFKWKNIKTSEFALNNISIVKKESVLFYFLIPEELSKKFIFKYRLRMEQDFEPKYFWYDYNNVHLKFKNKFSLDDKECASCITEFFRNFFKFKESKGQYTFLHYLEEYLDSSQ